MGRSPGGHSPEPDLPVGEITMFTAQPLDSHNWSELENAYGSSEGIPDLLRQLSDFPPDDEQEAEPYFSLWSALCHQGDIYSASYAAVPYIVSAISVDPTRARWTLFQLIACIEIARCNGRGPALPPELTDAYLQSLQAIPMLIGAAAANTWDEWYCGAALAAMAASKGFPKLAEALLELDSSNVKKFLSWACE
jgi:hypothetical protein